MTLLSGTRLGPYEIVAPLGAGGMGEVYKARDTRLDRQVAIKILPTEFANNEQLKIRFEREAKTISQLSHPNICALYDVGENYIVMELLEGESLADRLAKGPLLLSDVLKYGVQIAEALDKAHRAGVIHRDLKPGNIMLTKSGAKLLDFGLAKSGVLEFKVDGGATQQKPLTQEGTILGTFQYMAPEQLEGLEADARTDIFAFGSVLYEMATARRAFEGKSKTSLIAAIVKENPRPIGELQPLTPPALEHVVNKCLEKEPDDRWQSAHDIAEELRWISLAGSKAGVAATFTTRRKTREKLAWSVASFAIAAAVILLVQKWQIAAHQPQSAPMRFVIPAGSSLKFYFVYDVAISSDGRLIAYVESELSQTRLYLRPIDSLESKPIAGTEGAQQPFFSPDGKWLGFFAQHQLKKIPLTGGAPVAICHATDSRGGSWGDNGTIVFSPFFYSTGLSLVRSDSRKPEPLTKLEPGERSHRWPDMLPGSKAALFTIGGGGSWSDAKIAVVKIDTGERKVILEGGSGARYLPTGHIVYCRGSDLYAIAFDLDKLVTQGEPVKLVSGVADYQAGSAEYAVSRNGVLVTLPAGRLSDVEGNIVFLDRRGQKLPYPHPLFTSLALASPKYSPDGSRVAGSRGEEIWVYELGRGTSTRLTSGKIRTLGPIWTPDGTRVTYASERQDVFNPFWRSADGSDEERPLIKSDIAVFPDYWSADGTKLLVDDYHAETGGDVSILTVADGKLQSVVRTEGDDRGMAFSPDDKWVAYSSDESGRFEVYVKSATGQAGRWQISANGGAWAIWKRQDEILYTEGRKVMRVPIRTTPAFAAATPELLFDGPYFQLDATRDHQRFVGVEVKEKLLAPNQFDVVVNWFDEVRARMAQEKSR